MPTLPIWAIGLIKKKKIEQPKLPVNYLFMIWEVCLTCGSKLAHVWNTTIYRISFLKLVARWDHLHKQRKTHIWAKILWWEMHLGPSLVLVEKLPPRFYSTSLVHDHAFNLATKQNLRFDDKNLSSSSFRSASISTSSNRDSFVYFLNDKRRFWCPLIYNLLNLRTTWNNWHNLGLIFEPICTTSSRSRGWTGSELGLTLIMVWYCSKFCENTRSFIVRALLAVLFVTNLRTIWINQCWNLIKSTQLRSNLFWSILRL